MEYGNRGMQALRAAKLGGAAIVAINILSMAVAQAQDQGSAPAVEQVVVSSSRITSAGFNAPTPTTVLSGDDLQKQAESNVFTTIAELPSLQGSSGTATGNHGSSAGTNGLSSFNIHGIGQTRVLTLIDSQRVAPANIGGTVDVSQFPQMLIKRVDVVTGGASASWGSDAVSGVVNFILDNDYSGLKANVLTGLSTYGDDADLTAQVAAGTDFLNGKAHIVTSVEYSYEAGIAEGNFGLGCVQGGGRCWYSAPALLQRTIAGTPAGTPEYTYALNTLTYTLNKFGIITRGPLQGIAFNADGTPYNFNYGPGNTPNHDATGSVNGCVSPFCVGGDTSNNFGAGANLVGSLVRGNVYSRVSYDLSPDTKVWAAFMGSQVRTRNVSEVGSYRPDYYTIQCGNAPGGPNAFLPSQINQDCVNNNVTNFMLGSGDANFPGVSIVNQRSLWRYTAGVDGAFSLFGKDWTWNAYGEHANNNSSIVIHNDYLTPYLKYATDAVRDANGIIVCRDASARAAGCEPIDLFGNVPPTAGAFAWIQGGQTAGQHTPYQLTHERQEAASISVNGKPFDLWAGPVAVAAGLEYREEAFSVVGDPASNGGAATPVLLSTQGSNWFVGNYHNGGGSYHVNEGFVEVVLPLLNSNDWGHADADVAGRATGYSASGYINTWKAGLTWDTPIDGFRLRAMQSRDVRAPNLSELYAPPSGINNQIQDYLKPGVPQTTVQVLNQQRGNPGLKPEKSTNSELGFVYQPSWFPGFRLSTDYWRLAIKGEIGALTNQQIVQLCSLGNQNQCNALITVDGGSPFVSKITQVVLEPFNLATAVVDGFDYEASYQFDLQNWEVPGNFTLRFLATNTTKFITNSGIATTIPSETAGTNLGSVPHWKLFGQQTYAVNAWSFTIGERWISPGVFDRSYIQCTTGCPLPTANNPTINYNHMAGALYLDLGGSYDFNDHMTAYFKVDNAANVDPVPAPTTGNNLNSDGSNPTLYDTVGRMFHVGVRFQD